MDAVTIGCLGREYANAALSKARAAERKSAAVKAFEHACEVEQRAHKALMDAVKSNVEGASLG